MKDPDILRASVPVMKDIQWTSFENAKKLVKTGVATPQDFWTFCGYAGWGPGQLAGELDRNSWYMVATDSQTLLKELAKLSQAADPRDAGLDTWDLLMHMIGRGETAQEYCGDDFDDLMLKEWSRKHLLSTEAGGGAGTTWKRLTNFLTKADVAAKPKMSPQSLETKMVREGTLLRASSSERSPFLLNNQEFHKSLVLVVADDDEQFQIGVILNRPTSQGLDIQITEQKGGDLRKVTLPVRFGGQYAVRGGEPLLWFHCKPSLRDANVGSPVGTDTDGIYKCTAEQVVSAIKQGLASPDEFLVVSGASVWLRGDKSLDSAVVKGEFEVVQNNKLQDIWKVLSKQEVLVKTNLMGTIAQANQAWTVCGSTKSDMNAEPAIGGLGEGFDEEDDSVVFRSDVKVAKLSDDAVRDSLQQ